MSPSVQLGAAGLVGIGSNISGVAVVVLAIRRHV
jgi:hypothetical protein